MILLWFLFLSILKTKSKLNLKKVKIKIGKGSYLIKSWTQIKHTFTIYTNVGKYLFTFLHSLPTFSFQ